MSYNAKEIIKGIGVVNLLYYNPETAERWLVDYRIYNPDADKKTKHDHVRDMLQAIENEKKIPYQTVLADTWYASLDFMQHLENKGKIYFFPVRHDRQVDDSGGVEKYKRADAVIWDEVTEKYGKKVKLKGAKKDDKVQMFRVVAADGSASYIVTNYSCKIGSCYIEKVKEMCGVRWQIECLHRELKQLTGPEGRRKPIERCQCRKAEIRLSHIACAMLVQHFMTKAAKLAEITIYQLKQKIYEPFLKNLLQNQSVIFKVA